MRASLVHTQGHCLSKAYTHENKGANILMQAPKGAAIMRVKVVVEEAFTAATTLELKANGVIGAYGAAIDVTTVKTVDITGKGMLADMQEIVANITGAPIVGALRIYVEHYTPTRVEKGL